MTDSEEIYWMYPRHVAKIDAMKAIERALQRIMAGEAEGVPLSRHGAAFYLLERTKAFGQSYSGQRGAMTPYPATWFNRGGYMDDPREWEYITAEDEKKLRTFSEANVGVWRPQ